MRLMTFMARRFVAGDTVTDAMAAVAKLNKLNIMATIDHLGENVHNLDEAKAAADEDVVIFEAIEKHGVNSNVSIKLTMMGLEMDPEFCYENTKRLLEVAKAKKNFVRIDMEGSPVTQATLDIFWRLRQDYDNVGIVLQAYLMRSEEDAKKAAEFGAPVRICKGTYKEPPTIAFPTKEQVNENYLKLAKILLMGKGHVGIATHDRKMINPLRQFIAQNNIPKERYEWQMLYGIERGLQKQLAKEGEPIRIYIPYGTDWLGYSTRRMIERKENFFFVMKHFLRG